MNCRRVCGLLSAYLDSELTREEMAGVREHLGECPACRLEYQALADTKQLLSSLAHRASRAEIEALLQTASSGRSEPPAGHRSLLRPRPLAATALLSVAGLWLATTALDRGSPEMDDAGTALPPPAAAMLNAGVLPSALTPSFLRSATVTTAVTFPASPASASPATPVLLPANGASSAAPGGDYLGISASAEMPSGSATVPVNGPYYGAAGNSTAAIAAPYAPAVRSAAPGAAPVAAASAYYAYYGYSAAPSSAPVREYLYLTR